jgi:hypothetical protein
MKELIAFVLALIAWLPVNIYLYFRARDIFPCDLSMVKNEWLEIMEGN